MSWLTLVAMGIAGVLLVIYWQKKDVNKVLIGGKRLYIQALTGLFFGTFSSLLAAALIHGRRFKGVLLFFENIVQQVNPSFLNILFYSTCAGIGEEILFRAGIQPMIGVWPAAIVFVLLHGYINPYNLNMTIYGLFW
ncbi:MAG: CPBP family intramembrane metalloprotease [Bacteroidetes bacterium]|nr:CPBP family intramembrane metalloprotease [Bacteroidota bacterium]